MPRLPRIDSRAITFLGAYLAIWAAATAYLGVKGADWTFPLISLAVFGAALPALGIALTRKAAPPPVVVRRPTLELWVLLGFLVVYAVAFLGWGMSATRAFVPAGREQDSLMLIAKLVVHVAVPAILLAALGARLAPLFDSGIGRPGFWPPLLVLGSIILALMCVVSPALSEIAALHASAATLAWAAPAAFVWLALEAGLCEEFLFRAVLQTRLAAVRAGSCARALSARTFGRRWVLHRSGPSNCLYHCRPLAGRAAFRNVVGAHAQLAADRSTARRRRRTAQSA